MGADAQEMITLIKIMEDWIMQLYKIAMKLQWGTNLCGDMSKCERVSLNIEKMLASRGMRSRKFKI